MITSVGMNPSLRTSEFVCGQFLPDYKSRSNRFVGRGSTLNWTLFGVQKSFDLVWNLERRILRRKDGYGFSLPAQKMKILDGQHLLAKNHAKLTGCVMRNGFEGRKLGPLAFWLALNFKSETGDWAVGDTARVDERKIAQVGGCLLYTSRSHNHQHQGLMVPVAESEVASELEVRATALAIWNRSER